MKTKIKKGTIRDILRDVEVPESYNAFLTAEEKALVKFALAEMSLNDLSAVYHQRNRAMKAEIVWRLVQLGQKLAYITICEDSVFVNWDKVNQKDSTYLQGFMDCKTQVKGVIDNGLRKRQGRKTQ